MDRPVVRPSQYAASFWSQASSLGKSGAPNSKIFKKSIKFLYIIDNITQSVSENVFNLYFECFECILATDRFLDRVSIPLIHGWNIIFWFRNILNIYKYICINSVNLGAIRSSRYQWNKVFNPGIGGLGLKGWFYWTLKITRTFERTLTFYVLPRPVRALEFGIRVGWVIRLRVSGKLVK